MNFREREREEIFVLRYHLGGSGTDLSGKMIFVIYLFILHLKMDREMGCLQTKGRAVARQ